MDSIYARPETTTTPPPEAPAAVENPMVETRDLVREYVTPGGTGMSVATLVELADTLSRG